jgi:hypothetical protein
MARQYAVGDKVRLVRKVSIDHFVGAGMSITGVIAEIRENGYAPRYGPLAGSPRNYGIKFGNSSGVWWYASEEIKRIRGG